MFKNYQNEKEFEMQKVWLHEIVYHPARKYVLSSYIRMVKNGLRVNWPDIYQVKSGAKSYTVFSEVYKFLPSLRPSIISLE